jgi:L-amino acid N-acyltransferase
LLLQQLIAEARGVGKHAMLGAIDADNAASLPFHARTGFAETAHVPGLGYKFGRRRDLVFMQNQLALG